LPLYPSGFQQSSVRFSPNGHYVAFIANDTGRNELYVAPYPEPGARVRVSSNGASRLRWPRSSGEIVYVSGDRHLISVPVQTEPTLTIGPANTLFVLDEAGWINFDISADGQKLLAIVPQPDAERSSLTIVTGLDH
jgi:dipeptidyl aminopeptidase/acylaminoacyl peptidase